MPTFLLGSMLQHCLILSLQLSNQNQDPKMQKKVYTVLGMMSGTSLDGIDLSLATYQKQNNSWTYSILTCNTYPYEKEHINLIKQMQNPNSTYLQFHKNQLKYSQIVVKYITEFLTQNSIDRKSIDFLGYHGHTIFHNPSQGVTIQIGNLAYIAGKLQIDVVGNFRELDVHRGGQGAPLAPFGEELFGENIYLNFGGVANVGYQGQGYDITFCNMILNKYSQKIQNQLYDEGGRIGRQGQIDEDLLKQLFDKFTRQQAESFLTQIQKSEQSKQTLRNQLRTYYEFLAQHVINSVTELIKSKKIRKKEDQQINVYCTGGGALNDYLIELLNKNQRFISFIVPDYHIVQFKQALIFGLLAVKFMEGERNCRNGVGGQLVKGSH